MPVDQPAVPLTNAALLRLGPDVSVPTYDRADLVPSIVHIGVGGFHRAHFATYVQDLCSQGHRDWSITGAGVLAGDRAMADALAAQDHLYTLITRGPDSTSVEVIGSITGYLYAHDAPAALAEKMADPTTQIVSLTVTEGGYPIDDVSGVFLEHSPNAGPASAFGAIAAGLDLRRRRGGGPLTILSFDNIVSNGGAARGATLGEAARVDPGLAEWIDTSVTFPNAMVDRITPATDPADGIWLAERHGVLDRWPVVTEPFRQWVIEDEFAGARPPLEDLDVIVTTDVEPYEAMKLRLLNAGHSCLAYLAALDDIETVDAAMAHPSIRRYVVGLLEHEARPVLPSVAGIDLDAYIDSLIVRFSNPHIGDQISRLCLDGSAKFPKFLLPTVRAQLDADGPIALSALALAGWCDYLNGRSNHGTVIQLSADPMLDTAVDHARQAQRDPAAFLGFVEVFGTDLAGSGRFVDAFVRAVDLLRSDGIRSAIDTTLQEVGTGR